MYGNNIYRASFTESAYIQIYFFLFQYGFVLQLILTSLYDIHFFKMFHHNYIFKYK